MNRIDKHHQPLETSIKTDKLRLMKELTVPRLLFWKQVMILIIILISKIIVTSSMIYVVMMLYNNFITIFKTKY